MNTTKGIPQKGYHKGDTTKESTNRDVKRTNVDIVSLESFTCSTVYRTDIFKIEFFTAITDDRKPDKELSRYIFV